MRGAPTWGPNSPLEIGLGEVIPRAIQPEIASKSNVRQTIDRFMEQSFSFSVLRNPDRARHY
jgi:hypothetical protein